MEELISSLQAFHFSDCSERPTEMEEQDGETQKIVRLVHAELEITSKMQLYLEQVKRQEDIDRMMSFFEKILADLATK